MTAARFSPSGCYIASGDARGKLRVWSYDNEEHLCKLDLSSAMAGPIHDICWDMDSKRLCVVGEGSKTDSSSRCARVIQWDTGVSCGELGQHMRSRCVSCDFKLNRPMRIVTGGGDDSQVRFNRGPPFVRVLEGVSERCHTRGAVNSVRYAPGGAKIASVGTDRSVVFYDGKTCEMLSKIEDVHRNSIYACAWSSDGKFLLTCSADGTVKLIDATGYTVCHTWDVTSVRAELLGSSLDARDKVPMGAMQMGCAFVGPNDVPVSVCLNGEICILPTAPGISLPRTAPALKGLKQIKFLTGHQAAVSTFALDSAGMRLFTGDTDGVICSWDLSGGLCVALKRAETRGGEEPVDSTFMNKVHNGAITAMTHVNGTILSVGWDDTIRMGDGISMGGNIKLAAQPNAIAKGSELVVVVTVGGLILVQGAYFAASQPSLLNTPSLELGCHFDFFTCSHFVLPIPSQAMPSHPS